MIQTITLAPHDPLPDGPGRQVIVLRRFDEAEPARPTIQIVLTGQPAQIAHPRHPDGSFMVFDEAIAAARLVAREEGLKQVFVLDRLQGTRERDILSHDGDHSVHMERLSDTDADQRGSDMRDLMHRTDGA
jgi:hypothetical protein